MPLWPRRNRIQALKATYDRVFGGPDGQRVLADLCRRHFVLDNATAFDQQGRGDPLLSAHNDGRRSVVLDILSILDMSPESFRRLHAASLDDEEIEP